MWEAQRGSCCCYETTEHLPATWHSFLTTRRTRHKGRAGGSKCDFSDCSEGGIKQETSRGPCLFTTNQIFMRALTIQQHVTELCLIWEQEKEDQWATQESQQEAISLS